MSSVTFSTTVGGDGSTVTDDDNATTGLGNGGSLIRLVPMMQQAVNVASYTVNAAESVIGMNDLYLGSYSSNPTLNNSGGALTTGNLYFNNVANEMRVYNGSSWIIAYIPASGYLEKTGGTMTGDINFSPTQSFPITLFSTGDIVYSMDASSHPTTSYLPCDSSEYNISAYPTLASKLPLSSFTINTSPFDDTTPLNIIYVSAFYFALTYGGVYKSSDLTTWTKILDVGSSQANPHHMATNGTTTIVVAGDNYCWTSTDLGVTWATYIVSTSTSGSAATIAYGNSKFVIAHPYGGFASYSSDGITWTDCTNGSSFNGGYLKFMGSYFISVYGTKVNHSTDGITFLQTNYSSPYTPSFNDISYGNGMFVAVAQSGIIYSGATPDSLTYRSGIGTYLSVIYGATTGKWVIVGSGGKISYSTDAISWSHVSGLPSNMYFSYVTTDGTKYIAPNGYGYYVSTNGISWTPVFNYQFAIPNNNCFKYINSKWICLGYGNISSSTDLTTWTYTGFTFNYYLATNSFKSFISTGTLNIIPMFGGVLTTTDNITFTPRRFATNLVVALGYNGSNKFVALVNAEFVGNAAQAYYSSDGITWSPSSTTFSNAFNDGILAYGNGIWVLGSQSNYIYTSTDGISWTQRTSGIPLDVYAIKFWKNYFIIISQNSTYISSNGINWQQTGAESGIYSSIFILNNKLYYTRSGSPRRLNDPKAGSYDSVVGLGTINGIYPQGCAYGNGVYVFAIYPSYTAIGNISKLAYSTDGINFKPCLLPTDCVSYSTNTISHVCFLNNTFFAFESNGIVYQSKDGTSWTMYKQNTNSFDSSSWFSYLNGNYVLLGNSKFCFPSSTKFKTPFIESPTPAYIKI
jgi:hypothetical protein